MLEQMGALTLDADHISREITAPGTEALEKIVEVWGEKILNKDGGLNRGRLAEIVFDSEEETERLNSILHPYIIERENELIENIESTARSGIIVVEAALMIEAGSWERFDKIALVAADKKTRKNRMKEAKEIDDEMFNSIASRQMPDAEKIKYADYLIENNDSIEDLMAKTQWLYYKLCTDLEEKAGRKNV